MTNLLALSEPVQLALINGLMTAAPILFGLWLTYRKVGQVEKNTNSMREAMVKSATLEGHAAGVADQKKETVVTGALKEVLVAVAEIKGHAGVVAATPPHSPTGSLEQDRKEHG